MHVACVVYIGRLYTCIAAVYIPSKGIQIARNKPLKKVRVYSASATARGPYCLSFSKRECTTYLYVIVKLVSFDVLFVNEGIFLTI